MRTPPWPIAPIANFRLEGHTEFAHQNYVERPGESESNLGRNRHPASGKSEDHDIFILEMAPLELLGQTPTSINPVTKHLDHLLYCHQLVFKSSRLLGPMVLAPVSKRHPQLERALP